MPSDTYTLTIADAANAIPASGSVTNASVAADAAIAFSKLAALSSGNILVGSSGGVPTSVNPSGDVDISNTGVFSIASEVIVNADISPTAAIVLSKLAALNSGQIIVGNASNVATAISPSGDITLSNTGVFGIANEVIVNADVSPTAAIAGTKVSPNFGSQNIVTSGTLTCGNITTSGVTATTAANVTGGSSGNVLYQSTTNNTAFVANGTSGQILQSNGSAAPSWVTFSNSNLPDSTSISNGISYAKITYTPTYSLIGNPTSSDAATQSVAMSSLMLASSTGFLRQTTANAALHTIVPTTGNTANKLLTSNGDGTYSWSTAGAGSVTSVGLAAPSDFGLTFTSAVTTSGNITLGGTLAAGYGGTGQNAYTIGDILYANSVSTLAKLASISSGNVLLSNGSGTAPSWGKVTLTGHVSGTLPVANGGTGVTSLSSIATNLGVTSSNTISSVNGNIQTTGSGNLMTTSTGNIEASGSGNIEASGSGNIVASGTGKVGYSTGSGGAVTQDTSRTTGVTLDKTNGAITLVSAAGDTAWATFTVTNSTVAATDTVIVNQKSGTDLYMIHVTNVAAGSFKITFATTGGNTTEQPVFNFAVIKAVSA